MNNIKCESVSFLQTLLETSSPSGNEYAAINAIKEYLGDTVCHYNDVLGNLYLPIGNGDKLKILITAHCDEVGFQVTHIDDCGFIYVRRLGGLDRHTIPGTEVVILGKSLSVNGVFGKKSPHILNDVERSHLIALSDTWIDIGASTKEDALKYVSVGDYVTASSNFKFTSDGKRIISKGLDDKIGVYILVEALKKLQNTNLDISVVGVVTVQEEVGSRGSIIATHKINPDIGITLDVGIATDIPNMNNIELGVFRLGGGPGLCINADNNYKLVNIFNDTASENQIPIQTVVGYKFTGGTETAKMQLCGDGIVTAHISIPNRYMHSVVEMCDLDDITNAINLLYKTILRLSNYKKEQFNLFDE